MSEQLNDEQAKKLFEISAQLKKLLDMGAAGARAASMDSTLAPGDLIDLVWHLMFGKNREECLNDPKKEGAIFLLSVWNGHPILGWHLNNCPKEQIVMILSTAVAMVGKRMGQSEGIIEATISTLEVLKDQQDTEDEKGGDLPH